ncbi:MAG: serine hydrolase domain-containing protein [Bacteroidales bacterium]
MNKNILNTFGLFRSLFFSTLFVLSLLYSCNISSDSTSFPDGLPRSTPEREGISSEGLLRFVNAAEEQTTEFHSFMLLRHGKVVAEGWWHPYKPEINHHMYSVSKTFTSAAIGFAVQEGLLRLEDKVISFLPYQLPDTISSNLSALTIRNLLTMSAGQIPPPTFQITDQNWVKLFLSTPIDTLPGSRLTYSSYTTYMLSAILHKVTGNSVFEYLTPRLFIPLGITDIQWETDPDGINCGGWGLRIKTADLAKLGQLYIQKGKWNGKQLLAEAWVNDSTSPQIYQQPDRSPEELRGNEGAQGYGYQLWICSHNSYRIDGAFAQICLVIPEKDVVFAMTARMSKGDFWKPIWNELYPSLFDEPLAENKEAYSRLMEKLTSLHLKAPFPENESEKGDSKVAKSYTLDPNPLHLSQINFSFDSGGNCTMEMVSDTARYDFNFGLNHWMYGTTQRPGPYYYNLRRNPVGMAPFNYTGWASWNNSGELLLNLFYLTDIQSETFVCQFHGDSVSISITNTEFANDPPKTLTGRIK